MRIILSYVPFRNGTIGPAECTFSSYLKSEKEGLYLPDDGRNMNYSDRVAEQKDIKQFLEKVFKNRQSLSYRDYEHFNKNVSSEMFFSLMAIIHERLPCA